MSGRGQWNTLLPTSRRTGCCFKVIHALMQGDGRKCESTISNHTSGTTSNQPARLGPILNSLWHCSFGMWCNMAARSPLLRAAFHPRRPPDRPPNKPWERFLQYHLPHQSRDQSHFQRTTPSASGCPSGDLLWPHHSCHVLYASLCSSPRKTQTSNGALPLISRDETGGPPSLLLCQGEVI